MVKYVSNIFCHWEKHIKNKIIKETRMFLAIYLWSLKVINNQMYICHLISFVCCFSGINDRMPINRLPDNVENRKTCLTDWLMSRTKHIILINENVFVNNLLFDCWTYQRKLGNSRFVIYPNWPIGSILPLNMMLRWIGSPVMMTPIGWKEFPTIFWSETLALLRCYYM